MKKITTKTKKSTTKKRFYSYLLKYPTGHPKSDVPFYAGKGTGRRVELGAERNSHCERVIKKIQDAGLQPITERSGLISEEEAFEQETEYIQKFGLIRDGGSLTNMTYGGEGVSGRIVSTETRKKISEANKGRPLSEEHKKKLSKAHMGHPSSERQKKRASETHKRKPKSKEQRKKMSEANRGQRRSKETRANISKAKKGCVPWNKGKKGLQVAWNKGMKTGTSAK